MKVSIVLLGILLLPTSAAHALPMPCDTSCCEEVCTSTEVKSKRWVETTSQRWVDFEEEIIIEEEPKEEKVKKKLVKPVAFIPAIPAAPRVRQRACTPSRVYDYFFFNAHMKGGNYGGAYVSGWQMNDARGRVIRCPDPVVNSGTGTKPRTPGGSGKEESEEDRFGHWVTDYSGYYVYDSKLIETCDWIGDCKWCGNPGGPPNGPGPGGPPNGPGPGGPPNGPGPGGPSAIPEPATMFLFGTGLLGLSNILRRRK